MTSQNQISPAEIQSWLEWAGSKMLSLNVRGTWPESYRSYWPDYPDDKHTAYGYSNERLRPPAPSKTDIPLMDQILDLILIIPIPVKRQVVQARSLVSPINGRYLCPWTKIGILLHTDRRTVKLWHEQGINYISSNSDVALLVQIQNTISL